MSVKKNPRKATPKATKTTNKAEFEALRKELLPSDFDYLLATAKTMRDKALIRDIRRIVADWRRAGLPTAALLAVIDAVAESSKAGGDEAAMKIAIQAAFDKAMGRTRGSNDPKMKIAIQAAFDKAMGRTGGSNDPK